LCSIIVRIYACAYIVIYTLTMHTYTHISYISTYIYKERERERGSLSGTGNNWREKNVRRIL
jgi:hypothetical protein